MLTFDSGYVDCWLLEYWLMNGDLLTVNWYSVITATAFTVWPHQDKKSQKTPDDNKPERSTMRPKIYLCPVRAKSIGPTVFESWRDRWMNKI